MRGNERNVVSASEADIFIDSLESISDTIGKCYGADGLLLTEQDVSPEFFNLHSGLAGELFQKVTNYQIKLAVVLEDSSRYGDRVSELVYEHRHHLRIRFFSSEDEARLWLNG